MTVKETSRLVVEKTTYFMNFFAKVYTPFLLV